MKKETAIKPSCISIDPSQYDVRLVQPLLRHIIHVRQQPDGDLCRRPNGEHFAIMASIRGY